MRKALLLLVGTAVLWVPAVSMAGDSSSSPSKPVAKTEMREAESDVSNPASTCKSQRDGSNFAARHHGQPLTQFYGTNRGRGHGAGANAFGKCVSTIAKQRTEEDAQDSAESHDKDSAEERENDTESERRDSLESKGKSSANPAKTCKAMQASDLAHFRTTYGSRPNAFGRCVSGHANSEKG